MSSRSWFILAALALARISFGYQFQTVATLAPDLVPRFGLSYSELGAMIGAYMLMGAFAGVADLVDRTRGQAWLVSKCGPGVQAKTRAWLDHHEFWARTGMDRRHLRFCLKRPEKARHARELGLTAMIDDRVDVLVHLDGLVRDRLLFGEQDRPAPGWATPVIDWAAVGRWASRLPQ